MYFPRLCCFLLISEDYNSMSIIDYFKLFTKTILCHLWSLKSLFFSLGSANTLTEITLNTMVWNIQTKEKKHTHTHTHTYTHTPHAYQKEKSRKKKKNSKTKGKNTPVPTFVDWLCWGYPSMFSQYGLPWVSGLAWTET